MLETVEHETRANPQWTILWLHGLGADGHDFAPIVPELLRPAWPALRFVFPHAPMRPVTVNGGMHMRAWYDIAALGGSGGDFLAQRQDEAGVRVAIAEVQALIAREATRGVPASRLILAGFSQGGAIALATGLRRSEALAGIVVLSSYLVIAEKSIAETTPAGCATPVFMAHGSADLMVPQALGLLSRDRLRQLGVAVDWHSYPMAHQVGIEEISALGDWLDRRFAADREPLAGDG